ncbi:type II secretion system minor pseudopilin GspI [Sphingomonas sp. ID1715]|uniref:type II secretion system minor pseudopilin GspI n=1 Tax=Sphingomonas sp. ID1715 TaxID=1656898 RepID=UPI0014899A87|nr:type II secretion system minor pseudopilin GspI [Sphingomonas sp. ID1715]
MGDRQELGFTLLEMLVALAVFSLAALALLRLEGATVRQTGELDERMLAQLVARNLAVETITDPAPPPIGQSTGEAVNGGRSWRWARVTSRTPDQRLVRVDISVSTTGAPALLTIVRPAT